MRTGLNNLTILTIVYFLTFLTMSAYQQQATEITVFAAASLTEAFRALAVDFQRTHPQTVVRFNFGGSQQLVQQIAHGAVADVFASASLKQMDAAIHSGKIDTGSVSVFVRNHLVVILPRDNPGR